MLVSYPYTSIFRSGTCEKRSGVAVSWRPVALPWSSILAACARVRSYCNRLRSCAKGAAFSGASQPVRLLL